MKEQVHPSHLQQSQPALCFAFLFLISGMWCFPGSSENIKDFYCDHPAPANHGLQSGAVSLLLRVMDKTIINII